MTVHDPAAQASRLEQLNSALQQLESMQSQLDEIKRLTSVAGSAGALPYSGVNSVVQQGARLACNLTTFEGWDFSDEFEVPDLTSICQAKNFVRYALKTHPDEKTGRVQSNELAAVINRRRTALEDAALQGMALSLSERETAVEGAASLQILATEAQLTSNGREDSTYTNRLLIRLIEEQVATRSLIAALLEVQSGSALNNPNTSNSPVIRGVLEQRGVSETGGWTSPASASSADPFSGIE